jgi:hypothetical protein
MITIEYTGHITSDDISLDCISKVYNDDNSDNNIIDLNSPISLVKRDISALLLDKTKFRILVIDSNNDILDDDIHTVDHIEGNNIYYI